VTGNAKKVIFVSGTITQTADQIRPGNNTSIIGKDSSAKLVNFGMCDPLPLLYLKGLADMSFSLVKEASNVVIRNLGISKVLAANGDAIGVRMSTPDLPFWCPN
jgi:pectate lyase